MGAFISRLSGKHSGEGIASRFYEHRADFIRYLPVNLADLVSKAIESGLINTKDLDFYLNQHKSREDKINVLLTSVEQKLNGYVKFLQCLKKSKEHMGHCYLITVLEGKHFAEEAEIKQSTTFQGRINENMSELMDINLKELCPILIRKDLITLDELERLTDNTQLTEKDRNLLLFEILDTKGPTAHTLFVHCLGEEDSHVRHTELFELLSCDSEPEEYSPHARKRTRGVIVSPQKRLPKSLEMHGDLKTEEYAQTVRTWRRWVSNGQWIEAEIAENKYIQQINDKSKHLPVTVLLAGLLQSVIARIVRKQYTEAKNLLRICDRLCSNVKGDNYTFLHGRCMYTWSWLYRYLKQPEYAKKYALDAMAKLFNVESGEDKALANYGYASTMIDCHASAKFPDQKEMKSAESSLQFAIDCARIEDRGLDHIAPHSHLRLAQMYLGSTHYEPGKNTDPDSIRKASDCLKAIIDLGSIPPRSRCMFFLTESDLYRCKGNIDMARESAKCALRMAEENSFETEITSAKTKLESLK